MLKLAERAAASELNILILGESGTGKEMLASFIHDKSRRSQENMMELNCQALSESILESELFGHEKGAFTGASQKRIGLFEAAHGGTLFLDEIGGVSMNLQAKLLKAIESKTIYKMGSTTPVTVDFRLITATNRNLKADMDNELFRSDLFYRISTIVLEIPPLRERKEDIPLFTDYFIAKYSKEMLNLLLRQTRRWKIPAGTKCANKTGENDSCQNDVAIVYGKKTNYVVCIFAQTYEGSGVSGIRALSSKIYRALNN